MINELHYWTVAEAARNLKTGTLSPVTLVETLLDRIEALNPHLDAFITLTSAQALDVARQAEAEILAGAKQSLGRINNITLELNLFDFYSRQNSFLEVESLLPGFELYAITKLSQNPKNFRTDWVEAFYTRSKS